MQAFRLWLTRNPSRLLLVSFLAAALVGAMLLMIPVSVPGSVRGFSPVEAFFTATSAVCVTGLIVRDTATELNGFGQLVVLLLIQAGGLGILTFSNFLIVIQRRRVGMSERLLIEQSHGLLAHITPRSLMRRIVFYTVSIEFIGAAVLSWRFARDYPIQQAVWLGVFHAVSAFCNAGFSLFTNSLMGYRDDFVVNATIMSLIILGGLGFVVFADVSHVMRRLGRRPRPHLSLHTRMVLRTSFWLTVLGAVIFSLLEFRGAAINQPWWSVFHSSLFLSVTCRTAGFNTVDTAQLTNPTLFLMILFMAVGGSPGSTAGGMKTTTLATLHALVTSRGRNRPRVEYLNRSLAAETVSKSVAVAAGFFLVIICGMVLIQITERVGLAHDTVRGQTLDFLFEVVSAVGTVGLSTGITADLSALGKMVIVTLMFLGRLGPLFVAASLIGLRPRINYTFPEEKVNIG